MLTTRPPPRWRMAGNAARDMAKVPMVSISITVLKPLTLISSAEACAHVAAAQAARDCPGCPKRQVKAEQGPHRQGCVITVSHQGCCVVRAGAVQASAFRNGQSWTCCRCLQAQVQVCAVLPAALGNCSRSTKGLTRKFPAAQLTRISRPPSLAQASSTHRSQSWLFLTSPCPSKE